MGLEHLYERIITVALGALLLIALTADYVRKINTEKRLLAESKKNR